MDERVYKAYVGPLIANQVLSISLRVSGSIEVVRRSAVGIIWCRFDGIDPCPGEHDNFMVVKARRFATNKRLVVVRLVAEQDMDISVEGTIF